MTNKKVDSSTTDVIQPKEHIESLNNGKSTLWIAAGISGFLLIIPFMFITFPPSTDLPQHLCQIHLLSEILKGNTDLYTVSWHGPNILVYLLIASVYFIFSPLLTGKIVLIILILSWIASIYLLAHLHHYPVENALLACILVYNSSIYWGFLNFLVGWPVFVLWLIACLRPMNRKNIVVMLLISLFLYWAHALWFLIGSVCLFIIALYQFKNWKSFLFRLLPVLPVGIISLIWYPMLSNVRAETGFDISPYWFFNPLTRLSPVYLVDAMLGGIHGPLEYIVALIILTYTGMSLYTNRKQLKQKINKPLLLCSALFTVIMIFGPEQYMSTIFFSQRWFPCAVILFILGLPVPTVNRRLLKAGLITLMIAFTTVTTVTWFQFERQELSGLEQSLNLIPENQRVLGLDFFKVSRFIKWRPFLQFHAYAQAMKNAELNFSFAEHSSGIVQYKEIRTREWTDGLVWKSEKVMKTDLQYFDYILVNARDDIHKTFEEQPVLTSLTNGRWRLYQVTR